MLELARDFEIMTALTESSDDTRQAIRRAGLALMAREGAQSVSVARICREADLANGTFYNFYRDKSELVAEYLTDAYEGLAAAMRDADTPVESAYDAQLRDVKIIVAFTAANRNLVAVALRDDTARSLTEKNVTEMFLRQRVLGLKRGIEEGLYVNGIDPVVLARAENAVTRDLLLSWVNDPDPVSDQQMIDELVTVRLRLTNGPQAK